MADHPLNRIFRETVSLLDRNRVPYMVMGGVAVKSWGLPRATFDIDFSILLPPGDMPRLLHEFQLAGFTVPESFLKGHLDEIAGMRKAKAIRFQDGQPWDIDIFLVETPYQQAAFSRRRRVEGEPFPHWVIAPEDLILHKLLASRLRDLADVEDILLMSAPLDLPYMRKWAAVLGVSAALEERLATPPKNPRG